MGIYCNSIDIYIQKKTRIICILFVLFPTKSLRILNSLQSPHCFVPRTQVKEEIAHLNCIIFHVYLLYIQGVTVLFTSKFTYIHTNIFLINSVSEYFFGVILETVLFFGYMLLSIILFYLYD